MNVMDSFFEKINNLPMMPKVVQEVMQLLKNEDVDLNDLVHKIDLDQVISAKVLRLSNSSCYGRSRNIKTIDDAISVVGFSSLKTLVIASGITAAFQTIPGLDLNKFWRHSLVTASIARQLCKERKLEPESTYLAALMHNIGQLPIHMVFPVAGATIEETCHGQSVLERKTVEHAMLGIDHCQVGQELAKRWNFPEEIQRAIRYYAEPLHANACAIAPIIYVAAHIAFDLEAGMPADKITETLNPEIANAIGLNLDELAERIESYRDFVKEAESLI